MVFNYSKFGSNLTKNFKKKLGKWTGKIFVKAPKINDRLGCSTLFPKMKKRLF